jgi:hypothetical protein
LRGRGTAPSGVGAGSRRYAGGDELGTLRAPCRSDVRLQELCKIGTVPREELSRRHASNYQRRRSRPQPGQSWSALAAVAVHDSLAKHPLTPNIRAGRRAALELSRNQHHLLKHWRHPVPRAAERRFDQRFSLEPPVRDRQTVSQSASPPSTRHNKTSVYRPHACTAAGELHGPI